MMPLFSLKSCGFALGLLAAPLALADELPFAQALDTMVENHVDVRVQKAKVSIAEAQRLAARGLFSPQFNVQAQQLNSSGASAASPTTSGYLSEQAYTANATWNLFRSGADWATNRAANFEQNYQISLLDDAYISAEDRSARALFDFIQKEKILEAYRENEASARHFSEIAEARFAKSLLSREEADKVALDAASAEAQRADAEVQANSARGTVEALLGHANVRIEWPWEKQLTDAKIKELVDKPLEDREALNGRPDLRAAQQTLLAEQARKQSVFRSMLPYLDFTYSVGDTHVRGQTLSGWTTTATLTIPFWSGFKDYSAYRTQAENESSAEAKLHQVQLNSLSDAKSAQDNFRVSIQQYQSRLRNLKIARHLLDQDITRFKIGRSDANDLNQDLSRVTQAEILAVQGLNQAHLAYLQLLHAFGRSVR